MTHLQPDLGPHVVLGPRVVPGYGSPSAGAYGRGRLRLGAVAVLAIAVALVLGVATPGTLAAARSAGADASQLVAVVALAGAWLVVVRLLTTVLAVCLAAVPGAVGRTAARVAARVTPAVLRRTVQLSLGAAVVAGPLVTGAGSAFAGNGDLPHLDRVVSTTSAASAPVQDASGRDQPHAVTARTPATPPPRAHETGSARGSDPGGHVVVRPGDSLWSIAERALGPGHGPGDVARSWPRWYAANRSVIGPDPALLHPGQEARRPRQRRLVRQRMSPPESALRRRQTTAAAVTASPRRTSSVCPTRVDAPVQESRVQLRVVPTPYWDPPYDDGGPARVVPRPRAGRGAVDQPALELAFVLPSDLPAVPAAPQLHVVPGGATSGGSGEATGSRPAPVAVVDDDEDTGPSPTPSAGSPDPRGWAGRLALAAVEVLAGTRPLPQLRRWTSDEVYGQLRRQSHHGRVAERRPTAAASAPRVLPMTRVRTVRVCEPGDGVAEASVVVDDGRRVRALALRLEGVDGRWRCTELDAP